MIVNFKNDSSGETGDCVNKQPGHHNQLRHMDSHIHHGWTFTFLQKYTPTCDMMAKVITTLGQDGNLFFQVSSTSTTSIPITVSLPTRPVSPSELASTGDKMLRIMQGQIEITILMTLNFKSRNIYFLLNKTTFVSHTQ